MAQVHPIPLTDDRPYLERYWKISDLIGCQADRCQQWRAPTNRNSTSTKVPLVKAPHKKYEGLRTEIVLRLPCITDLWVVQVHFCVTVIVKPHYLVFKCQEVVVYHESSQTGFEQLDFKCLEIP